MAKDPDSGKRIRIARPKGEWITRTDESLRIVSDELFARAKSVRTLTESRRNGPEMR